MHAEAVAHASVAAAPSAGDTALSAASERECCSEFGIISGLRIRATGFRVWA